MRPRADAKHYILSRRFIEPLFDTAELFDAKRMKHPETISFGEETTFTCTHKVELTWRWVNDGFHTKTKFYVTEQLGDQVHLLLPDPSSDIDQMPSARPNYAQPQTKGASPSQFHRE